MKSPLRTLVVVATYNEIDNLPRLTDEILLVATGAEILVVDDHSPDGTGEWCDTRSAEDPRFHVIHRDGKLGLGTATVAGMQFALQHGFDYVLVMDADFSHPPRYIPDLLTQMADADEADGYDVMIGSRYIAGGGIEGWPTHRRIMSRCVNAYARFLLGLKVRDCSGAYRCYRVEILRRVDLHKLRARGYAYVEELLWRLKRAGARIGETPIVFIDRQHGHTKIDWREAVAALAILFRLGIENYLHF